MADDTTTTLILEIKQRAMIPTSQKTYENADILRMATQEMDLFVIPMILASREEYFVYEVDSAYAAEIDIHERAIGGVLRDVFADYGTGQFKSIPYLDPDQRERSNNNGFGPLMFYLRWNKIVLAGNGNGTIKQTFYIRPGRFVETSETVQISAINTGTNTVSTTGAIPASFIAGVNTDMISNKNMHVYMAIDKAIVSTTVTDIVYASLPTGLAVGDYVSLANESSIVQLPREIFPLLAQKTAATILQSLGDPKWKDAAVETERLKEAAVNLINPRVHGEDKIIVSNMQRNWWFY